MKSAVYQGRVRHRRFEPVEQPRSATTCSCCSWTSTSWTRCSPGAGSGPPGAPRRCWLPSRATTSATRGCRSADAVRDLVAERTGVRPTGPDPPAHQPAHLRLPASTRSASTTASTPTTARVETIVAEINNTPWGERHCYVLAADAAEGRGRALRFRFAKDFHVSPFMPMDSATTGGSCRPGDRLLVHMETIESGRRAPRRHAAPDTPRDHRPPPRDDACSRHPFMTGKVVAAIYWQALRLWWKRCPFHPHPDTAKARRSPPMTTLAPTRVASPRRAPAAGARASTGWPAAPSSPASAQLRTGRILVRGARRRASMLGARRGARAARSRCTTRASGAASRAAARSARPRPTWTGTGRRDDLPGAARLFVRNRASPAAERARASARSPHRVGHVAAPATRAGAAAGTSAAHYDLGNDFFEIFLDETMTYSCGIFERPTSSLRDASIEKLDRICRKLDLRPARTTCWRSAPGGGASRSTRPRGTAAASPRPRSPREQAALARRRVREAGLEDRVTVLEADYRDLEGTYDKLVSIEMIEAVGHEFLDDVLRPVLRAARRRRRHARPGAS